MVAESPLLDETVVLATTRSTWRTHENDAPDTDHRWRHRPMTDDDIPTQSEPDDVGALLPVERRTYMSLFAAGAVAGGGAGAAQAGAGGTETISAGGVSPAAGHGYGAGGYGQGVYGGGEVGPPPVVGDDRPQDLNDDGLYEDVNGDGEANVFDVQILFNNLDNPAVQDYAEYYNFSGQDEEEVGIFDVQALFNRI